MTIVALTALVLFVPRARATDRGLKAVVVRDRDGRQVDIYQGSHALVVGVSDYTRGWPDLHSVPAEILTVQAALERSGFSVVTVLNPDAEALECAFEDFIVKHGYEPDNRLVFFFSGHGFSRAGGTKGYLVPTDAPDPTQDKRGFLKRALSMSQIKTWAREMDARHAIFLFDSCFSGTIFKSKALPVYPPHITALAARPVRQFISAGDAGETVPAKSVFTPMFVRGLRGDADLSSDGYVTGQELGMFIRDQVLYYQTGQTPQYGKIRDPDLDEGDFVFTLGGNTSIPTIPAPEVVARAPIPPPEIIPSESPQITKSATIEKVRAEFDVYKGGRKGMRIHAEFTINGLEGEKACFIVFFYDKDGNKLRSPDDNAHRTTAGNACSWLDVVCTYENSFWDSSSLFIPYEELHLGKGQHALSYAVEVWDESGDTQTVLTAADRQEFTYTTPDKTARIESVRADHNVFENGRKGMRVHAKIHLNGMKGEKASFLAFFYDGDNNTLQDTDDTFTTSAGKICCWKDVVPKYENALWEDATMFLPYEQLHLTEDRRNLSFRVVVRDESGKSPVTVVKSDPVAFTYTHPGRWATLDDTRTEFDVVESGEKGMRIHTRLNIRGMKGELARVTAYFHFAGGTPLKDFDKSYTTNDGQASVGKNVTPSYDASEWEDLTLFIPYSQLHLGKGEHSCKYDILVWDKSGASSLSDFEKLR